MPLCFFHLCDGSDALLDPDGRELGETDEIARAALVEARSIISDDARSGFIRLDQRIEVEDEAGRILHRLEFEDAVEIVQAPQRPKGAAEPRR